MAARWELLEGSPGEPLLAGRDRLTEVPKGFRRNFGHGAMYWHPDCPDVRHEIRNRKTEKAAWFTPEISLRCVGFHCFGETEGFAGADEVYFATQIA